MAAAVLLPTRFVGLAAERLFLTEADRLNPVCRNASRNEGILHSAGAVVAQSQVVFGGSALVAVSLNGDAHVGVLLQERSVRLNERLLVGPNVRLVVIELHVLHVLSEELLFGE